MKTPNFLPDTAEAANQALDLTLAFATSIVACVIIAWTVRLLLSKPDTPAHVSLSRTASLLGFSGGTVIILAAIFATHFAQLIIAHTGSPRIGVLITLTAVVLIGASLIGAALRAEYLAALQRFLDAEEETPNSSATTPEGPAEGQLTLFDEDFAQALANNTDMDAPEITVSPMPESRVTRGD